MNSNLKHYSGKGQIILAIQDPYQRQEKARRQGVMFGISKDLYRNFGVGFALGAVIVFMQFFGATEALAL